VLYELAVRERAAATVQHPDVTEQHLIAHELYHALAECAGVPPWQVSESDADGWAHDLLIALREDG
jgi:hypothetical protein